MMLYKLCPTDIISTNKITKFIINKVEILVVKSALDQYFAFQNNCTHADKPLENGLWNPDKAQITCPFHRAIFALEEEGKAIKAPAAIALKTYKVLLQKENEIDFLYIEM